MRLACSKKSSGQPPHLNILSLRLPMNCYNPPLVARTIEYEIATMPKMLYVFFLLIHHCNSLNLSFLLVSFLLVGNSGAFT